MSSEKRSISAPADLFAQADVRRKELGYDKFSDYIQHLLRADVLSGGAHIRETAPPYKVNSSPALTVGKKIADVLDADARGASKPAPPQTRPTTYKTARSSKKKPAT